MIRQFSKATRIVNVLSYASGTASRTSTVVDAAGYDGVCFVVHFATIAASAVNTIKVSHSDAVTDNDTLDTGADITGTSQSVSATDDNKVFFIDIARPRARYLQLTVGKDSSNACAESAIAYLYRADYEPVTHATGSGVGQGVASTGVAGEAFVAPITGTA